MSSSFSVVLGPGRLRGHHLPGLSDLSKERKNAVWGQRGIPALFLLQELLRPQ